MKMKRLATALERGRVPANEAHACGLVSSTMTRRESGGPGQLLN